MTLFGKLLFSLYLVSSSCEFRDFYWNDYRSAYHRKQPHQNTDRSCNLYDCSSLYGMDVFNWKSENRY